ncbi:hypothetical protein [Asticcacaulis sp. YBE204]|uniref:hypothetical protein n=1 Tax=Asticcacaulis sp. YBE204 TaxID=1282363 RepID=UPI0003C3EB9B|nr:hypothetical protein [Asticcacaulis sp. YBE204]ESQ80373.1 hypothetical protein AEYBE204_03670 [Asticcacaulis sp. YBE204]
MFSSVVTCLAVILIVLAIVLLYLKWRGQGLPAGFDRAAVPVAWLALAVSAVLWMLAYEPDFGLPVGCLIAMSLPLALIAWRNAKDDPARHKPEKDRRARSLPDVKERFSLRKGGRIVARLLSSFVISPLMGMAVGMVAWLYMPGHGSTRYAWAVFAFVTASVIGLVIGNSAQRPWRALGVLSLTGAVSAAVVGLPLVTGAH